MTEYERCKQTNDDARREIIAKFNAGKAIRDIKTNLSKNKAVIDIIRVYKKPGRVNSLKTRITRYEKINVEIKEGINKIITYDAYTTL
jgi:hypothetical protein